MSRQAVVQDSRRRRTRSVEGSDRDEPAPDVWGGVFVLSCSMGGLARWSVTAKLDGAVEVTGAFTVDSNRKAVAFDEEERHSFPVYRPRFSSGPAAAARSVTS